jgi:hypothetical protein
MALLHHVIQQVNSKLLMAAQDTPRGLVPHQSSPQLKFQISNLPGAS